MAQLAVIVQANILYLNKKTADRENMMRYRRHDRSVSSVSLWKIEI